MKKKINKQTKNDLLPLGSYIRKPNDKSGTTYRIVGTGYSKRFHYSYYVLEDTTIVQAKLVDDNGNIYIK